MKKNYILFYYLISGLFLGFNIGIFLSLLGDLIDNGGIKFFIKNCDRLDIYIKFLILDSIFVIIYVTSIYLTWIFKIKNIIKKL